MKSVPSSEIAKNFGEWHDIAVREPIAVTRYGRPSVVVLSARTYQSLLERAPATPADKSRADRTNLRGIRLFSPHQILLAYSKGEIDSGLALNRLGLDHYRQLAIAMADAGLALPGTDEEILTAQADLAMSILTPVIREDKGA